MIGDLRHVRLHLFTTGCGLSVAKLWRPVEGLMPNSIGRTLPQFGHHTFGNAFFNSSMRPPQNRGVFPIARYRWRIHSMPARAAPKWIREPVRERVGLGCVLIYAQGSPQNFSVRFVKYLTHRRRATALPALHSWPMGAYAGTPSPHY